MITQNDVQRLFSSDVYETDGTKIGSTGQVYLDRQSGDPAWVSVKTGLFGTKESLVPLQKATLREDRIVVPFDKAQIKNAPRVEPDDELTPAEEDELYRYYGIGEESYTSDQFGPGQGQFREGQPGFDPNSPTGQQFRDGQTAPGTQYQSGQAAPGGQFAEDQAPRSGQFREGDPAMRDGDAGMWPDPANDTSGAPTATGQARLRRFERGGGDTPPAAGTGRGDWTGDSEQR